MKKDLKKGAEEEIFLKSEADAWYKRNAHALVSHVRRGDIPLMLVRRYMLTPKKVLEVGASNGWRLEALRKRRPRASYVGVEPSQVAIIAGKKAFPKISFLHGVASTLPVKRAFDLVLVVFVLHWVSREKLLASIAEIDRVVAENGYLLVSDFLPRKPRKNQYHHLNEGISTWKMDYGGLFEATGNYRQVERFISDYMTDKRATTRTPDNMRAVATLYQKKTGAGYITHP